MLKFVPGIYRYSLVEHFLFLLMGILAAYFVEERIVADSGYYLFRVINNESFWVEHNRFVLVFPEIMPLLAVKLGLGLKWVLYFYSVGNVLMFYVIFLIARYYYKNEKAGIMILLLQTLGIASGFFVPMFELYYASVLLVLFAVALYADKRNYIVLSILSVIILTAHPYALFLYLFVLGFHALEFKLKHWRLYGLLAVIVVGVYLYKSYHVTEYEQGKTNAFLNNLHNANYDLAYIKSLGNFLLEYYWELLLVELLAIVMLLLSRMYIKALLTILGFLGVLAVANISYYGFTHSRYQEQVYFALSFLAAYPLVMLVLEKKSLPLKTSFTLLFVLLIGVRVFRISAESKDFTGRVNEMKNVISLAEKSGKRKYMIYHEDLNYYANWSYPIETMLLSALESPENTRTICLDEDLDHDDNKTKLTPGKYLFRRWEIYPLAHLNKNYFMLDSSSYELLKIK